MTPEEVYSLLHLELQDTIQRVIALDKKDRKYITHSFTNTVLDSHLKFNRNIEAQTLEKYIILFEGGYGHGYYHVVRYNIYARVYEYCIQKDGREIQIVYFSQDWVELREKLIRHHSPI